MKSTGDESYTENIEDLADKITTRAGAFFASVEQVAQPHGTAERTLFAHIWALHLENARKFWKLAPNPELETLLRRTTGLLAVEAALSEVTPEEKRQSQLQGLSVHKKFFHKGSAAKGGARTYDSRPQNQARKQAPFQLKGIKEEQQRKSVERAMRLGEAYKNRELKAGKGVAVAEQMGIAATTQAIDKEMGVSRGTIAGKLRGLGRPITWKALPLLLLLLLSQLQGVKADDFTQPSPSYTPAPTAPPPQPGIQLYNPQVIGNPSQVVQQYEAYKKSPSFFSGLTSPNPKSTRQKLRESVSQQRKAADNAMRGSRVTKGVVPWMELQSVKSILAYSQYDGYKLTETTTPPVGAWLPGDQARSQIELLQYPGYYIGDVTIVSTANLDYSEDIKVALGMTGPEGATNSITGVYFKILAANNQTEIDSSIAKILELKKERGRIEREVADMTIQLRQRKAALAKEVQHVSERQEALKGIMDTVGLKELVGRITASSIDMASIKSKNPFITITQGDEDEEERGPFQRADGDPIGTALAVYDDKLQGLADLIIAIAGKREHIHELEVQEREALVFSEGGPLDVTGVYVPATKFSPILDTVVKKYIIGSGTDLERRVAALPSYTPNIFKDAFLKSKQMLQPVAALSLKQSMQKRAAWGEQEFIGLLEDYQQGLESYAAVAEQLDMPKIHADVEKGLVPREGPGQLQVAGVELRREVGVFKAAIQSLTSASGDDVVKAIAKAYITDIAVEGVNFENEAESGLVNTIISGINERGASFIESLDEVATEVGRTVSNTGINLAKTGAWYTSSALIALGIFVFDLFFMTTARAEIIKEAFPKHGWKSTAVAVGAGALGLAGYFLGGSMFSGMIQYVAGTIFSYVTGSGGLMATVTTGVTTAMYNPTFAKALLMGFSSILGSVGTLVLFYARFLKGDNLYIPTIAISVLVRLVVVYMDNTLAGKVENMEALAVLMARKAAAAAAARAPEAAVLADRAETVRRELAMLQGQTAATTPVVAVESPLAAELARIREMPTGFARAEARAAARSASRSRATAAPVVASLASPVVAAPQGRASSRSRQSQISQFFRSSGGTRKVRRRNERPS